MRSAVFMSDDQVLELVARARQDSELWQALKERELEIERIYATARAQGKWPDSPDFVIDPPPLRPTFHELLSVFLERVYGANAGKYERGSLLLCLRKEIRIELGLPV
jgi:hypothetical protein